MGGAGLRLAPVVDGRSLPRNPFDPDAPEISATVPLLIGSVETEVTFMRGTPLDPMDDDALHAHVKQALRGVDDDAADRLIDVYRKGRPNISNTDLYLILSSDATFRAGVLTEAERKADQGAGLCLHVLFHLEIAGAGRKTEDVPHARNPVCLRQC